MCHYIDTSEVIGIGILGVARVHWARRLSPAPQRARQACPPENPKKIRPKGSDSGLGGKEILNRLEDSVSGSDPVSPPRGSWYAETRVNKPIDIGNAHFLFCFVVYQRNDAHSTHNRHTCAAGSTYSWPPGGPPLNKHDFRPPLTYYVISDTSA